MKLKWKQLLVWSLVAMMSLLLVACGGSTTEPEVDEPTDVEAPEDVAPEVDDSAATGDDVVTIRYVNWDINQFPAYQECAANFNAANPNIIVDVQNLGWDDYWNGLQTEMVAGGAADVFTNHLAKYPEFASKGQILDIQPFVERDGVPTDIYIGELEQLWTRDDARYGLPKDWDTVSVIFNRAKLEEAGVTEDELNNATWNPEDGGTFTEIVKKLTIDANGNNALSPDFNKDDVATYGYGTDINGAGAYGQTQYSHFAASTGWNFVDGLYATEYHYDDPRFVATMEWFQTGLEEGWIAPYEDVASLGNTALFQAGNTAMTTDGSWQIGFYSGIEGVEVGFARLPEGPEGRKSMFNGLADSIWTGSEHPDEAWEWVKYAASPECEALVGTYGVVFPATEEGTNNALAVYEERGIDVSAFTEQALAEGGTFLFPVTDNASEIADIMSEVMDAIFLSQAEPADILPTANEEVNSTFE